MVVTATTIVEADLEIANKIATLAYLDSPKKPPPSLPNSRDSMHPAWLMDQVTWETAMQDQQVPSETH